jgi:hypothetical protein
MLDRLTQLAVAAMETTGEELSRLRAENSCLKQLLESKDALLAQSSLVIASNAALLACKDELLANRAEELQRLKSLATSADSRAASMSATLDTERQHVYDSSSNSTVTAPLDRDELLDHVFSFVGGGDHLYVGGVCRRWRGLYMQYCAQNSTSELDTKLVTRHRSVLMTESRLQLALSSGLSLEGYTFDSWTRADLICGQSLEPTKVLTLLRLHGVPWSTLLCDGVAYCNKLTLLQWLHSHSCPWDTWELLNAASAGGSIAMLEWLVTVTTPWSADLKLFMLNVAARFSRLAVALWLRADGADWPTAFSVESGHDDAKQKMCWSVSAVQWALSCGSGWLDWKCEDYAADQYGLINLQQQAAELLTWAHANGCPCTCGHIQQQQ